MNKRTVVLLLTVRVNDTVPRVTYAMQNKKKELQFASQSGTQALVFEISICANSPDGVIDFSGEFVFGPRGGRFLYVNSGTMAGQPESCWTRRAKLSLQSVIPLLARLEDSQAISAEIAGTAGDGGPACGTVPVTWRIPAQP